MKRFVFILLSAITVAAILPSCSKSLYPNDPYRGATGNPGTEKSKPNTAKAQRAYRTLPKSRSGQAGGGLSKQYRGSKKEFGNKGKMPKQYNSTKR